MQEELVKDNLWIDPSPSDFLSTTTVISPSNESISDLGGPIEWINASTDIYGPIDTVQTGLESDFQTIQTANTMPTSSRFQMINSRVEGSSLRSQNDVKLVEHSMQPSKEVKQLREKYHGKYKERNRQAAAKSRRKHEDLVSLLEAEQRDEQRRREIIELQLSNLKLEVSQLREELRLHIQLSGYIRAKC
ncbi:BRLZ domain containing protein [Pyrenophora tritici-repentis]|nr:BZIP transcription factor-like protein [Pyrenophora tritici-repentis]KAF7446563.1 BZIP transcription factor protein [Pyrenophora tritici-repentis]KAF7448773.1 BZIP transcription factor protein [Pyrenophora tritici-repentis]KAF7567745.1 bZIP-2 multi-domain protein [Pyrenophora tritici-repentis]KAG9384268.1 BZIP transcription factor protein [Pyrenophora tritici-repentis]